MQFLTKRVLGKKLNLTSSLLWRFNEKVHSNLNGIYVESIRLGSSRLNKGSNIIYVGSNWDHFGLARIDRDHIGFTKSLTGII